MAQNSIFLSGDQSRAAYSSPSTYWDGIRVSEFVQDTGIGFIPFFAADGGKENFSPTYSRQSITSDTTIFDFPTTPSDTGFGSPYISNFSPFATSYQSSAATSQTSEPVDLKTTMASTNSNTKEDPCERNSRRRHQNRVSQQAFRKRRDRHIKDLEHQLEAMEKKQNETREIYSRNIESCIKTLTAELQSLRTLQDLVRGGQIPENMDSLPGSNTLHKASEYHVDGSTAYHNHEVDSNA